MLFLLFQIGEETYALPAERIVEILPVVALKRIRGAPAEVAGSFRYQGAFVPVVDLCQLELGHPAPMRMGTRIVIVEVAIGHRQDRRERVGLLAQGATEVLRCEPDAFAPFALSQRGLVQRLDIDAVLPLGLRRSLFSASAEDA